MVFTEEDKAFIENMYLIKGYGLRRLAADFPGKGRKLGNIYIHLYSSDILIV